jgi:hypothetical protein
MKAEINKNNAGYRVFFTQSGVISSRIKSKTSTNYPAE